MTAAAAAADPVEAASLTAPLVEVNTEVVAMVAALPVRVAERGPGVGRRLWNLWGKLELDLAEVSTR